MQTYNLFAINVETIDGFNCRSDLWTFRSPEEQKGCRKRFRETNDLLYIDRTVISKSKSKKKNLAMAWIDYKKVYDMVSHSQIKECLDLFEVAENIKTLLVNSMDKWRVMLCPRN